LYDKLERARIQTAGRVSLMTNTFSQLGDVIGVVTLISALIYFEPWLILLLLLSIIPSFINELKYSNSRYSIAKSWTAERRELDYLRYIGANTKTATEIKLFGLTDFIANRFSKLANQYYEVNKTLAISRTIWGAFLNVLGILSYYAAYVLIIYRVISGFLSIGELTFLAGSFRRLKLNMQAVLGRFTRISESALQLGDYFEFLHIEGEKETEHPLAVPQVIRSGFELKEVSFRYPGSEELVLDRVSFEIRAGEKLAFVGENGAGKTTLIKLLLRFYQPESGSILLDGIDIRRFNKAAYQQMFGVIFQDFVRYEFTIRENIAIGNINELDNMETIETAASLSLADQVVAEMKNGYDQQLGKRFARGTELSGGQWQKIALGRAYMKNAAILILDEPTSALDARAEYEAFQRFIGLTKGKTSIIISHRFSTVRMADRIVVLKDGRILEKGSHEELMEQNGLYAELFDLQAAGYQ
jgi:ATP-binding cassette, subfamily B, bacterial